MPLALLALAIGAFGIGTTEFGVMGVLPQIADGFHVSVPTAGLLVTGYALGVVVGAPLMTVLGTKVPRKRMLMLLMGLFTLGNLLTALAPTFAVMLVGRIVASLAHGAFFGIGSVVASRVVAPAKRAGAIALMFTGLTVANVVGVPGGTLIGQHAGWRVTFLLIAALGLVGLAGIAALIPEEVADAGEGVRVPLRDEVRVLREPQVLLAMATTVLGFGGVFAAVTYIAPMMTHVTGYADGSVTWLLVLLGLGMVVGNLIGGRYADRALMPMLYTTLGGLAVVLALFTVTAHHKAAAAVTLTLIGALGFATTPPLQKRVLDHAAAAPTLASAMNIAAFNLGNALSAWIGGLIISAGFGYTAPNWLGAAFALAALGTAAASAALDRRGARAAHPAAPDDASTTPARPDTREHVTHG